MSEPTFTSSLKGTIVARILCHAVQQVETFILCDYREWTLPAQHCVNEGRVLYLIICSATVIVWLLLKRSVHVKEHTEPHTFLPRVWKIFYIRWKPRGGNIDLWCPWPMVCTGATATIIPCTTQYSYNHELIYSRRTWADILKFLFCFPWCLFQCIPGLLGVAPNFMGEKIFSFRQCFA